MPEVYYNPLLPVVDEYRRVVPVWDEFFRRITGVVNQLAGETSFTIGRGTYTELNALGLGAENAGALFFETETGHELRWTGTVWEFAPGDVGNKFKRNFAGAPQDSAYWALCNGVATTYLALGAALSLTPITPPNLTGNPAFDKSIAAYTGTIVGASGTSGSTAPGISGSTASESSHTHAQTAHFHAISGVASAAAGVDVTVRASSTQDDIFGDDGTGPGTAHSHGVGSLAVDGHSHGVGSQEPASIGWLPYFRR